ncbi:MAG: LD-carboxypeptidase [Oscillospiraceae bacterium]|nr:LD-carboxypeptidase [Oscillospiraceae bacterium]
MIASKLKLGDEVRVIAPSRNLTEVRQDVHHHAVDFWAKEGFHLTFSKHSREIGQFHSSSIASRVEDIHEAFCNPMVKMVITCLGGFNANQLLRHLDYDLIAKHPKILCGFSDITALHNAIYAKTGLVTYHGPHYGTFAFKKEAAYTRKAFFDCVMNSDPIVVTPSETTEKYHTIQEGCCEGTIIGGNLCTLNLLQGTPYMPDIRNKVLFLEDDNIMGEYFCYEFDRNLESLLQTEGAETIKGIILGRFDDSCSMTVETIADIIRDKVPPNIPVVFGVDFGHVFPMITFPIGGIARITAVNNGAEIEILSH